ncbi:carboxylic ester hydrolase [Nocardioides szechwanensis]|uniref:Carboxylic ester hydrolase n=1 Tax=Nocardioides szechwanensis TaxID=1005944 RepID=A0A1H0GX34_9ACTN|nr:carboxylic ester hydrolase [Nocardioides szechwanensis]SDO11352.1 para-nitrobenzyl esterase [Nocardioides szechwanensis]
MGALALLLLLPLAAACTDDPEPGATPVVETSAGTLRGLAHDGIRSFRGIPYAAAPVGDLRWAEPQPAEPWDGERDATAYGSACLQSTYSALGPVPTTVKDASEDCLFLNVNRPQDDSEDLPVMVYLHGGGFMIGTGGDDLSNAPPLVRRGVVLVTLNYRLGRLGFFAHPALRGDVANFGLLDQVAALEWVRDNIAEFGGDPDNVTLFGSSAGGMSVNALMASPRAEGLFHRAISQSGLGREPSQTLAAARRASGLRGATLADLRGLDAETVMEAPLNVFTGDVPLVDGGVLPASVAAVFAAGDEAEVPYLVGTTDLEFPDSVLEGRGSEPAQLRADLAGAAERALVAAYGSAEAYEKHFFSDAVFTEPARFLAAAHAERAPTYLYRFSIASPATLESVGGAVHSSDIAYAFGTTSDARAETIGDYLVAFATTGDPNHDGAPEWPTPDGGALLGLTVDGPVAVAVDPWRRRLDAVQRLSEAR